jgi:uncharacterized protein (TIGR02117 family)
LTVKRHPGAALAGLAVVGVIFWFCDPTAAAIHDVGNPAVPIQVVSNGWHTGIVLRRAAIPPGAIPEVEDFPGAAYLEFGWGDAEFYPAKDYTVGLALRAALFPSAALMHVAGLAAHPGIVFPGNETLELELSAPEFSKLVEFISGSFMRINAATRAFAIAPGLYSFSKFYPAKGKFHLLNTCNHWTARALAAAGLDVDPSWTLRAEGVMAQLRDLRARRKI